MAPCARLLWGPAHGAWYIHAEAQAPADAAGPGRWQAAGTWLSHAGRQLFGLGLYPRATFPTPRLPAGPTPAVLAAISSSAISATATSVAVLRSIIISGIRWVIKGVRPRSIRAVFLTVSRSLGSQVFLILSRVIGLIVGFRLVIVGCRPVPDTIESSLCVVLGCFWPCPGYQTGPRAGRDCRICGRAIRKTGLGWGSTGC